MSTSYYRLADPITNIVVLPTTHPDVFLVHLQCDTHGGGVLVPGEHLSAFVRLFADRDAPPVLRTYWAGPRRGLIVESPSSRPADGTPLISECGVVRTVGEVLAEATEIAHFGL